MRVGPAFPFLAALAAAVPALAQTPTEAMRTLYFKLPLAQPEFHWKFADREAFLAGRLTLRILRGSSEDAIVVFDSGRITPGWSPIESQGPGEIYFGFASTARYLTAPQDSLVIELLVREALSGSGPELSGFLPAGTYRTVGSYAQLAGYNSDLWLSTVASLERIPVEQLRSMPETQALLARLNAETGPMELIGFVECWRERWSLERTGWGWMSPAQVAQRETQRRELEASLGGIRSRLETVAQQSGEPLPATRWSGTTCEPRTRESNVVTGVQRGATTGTASPLLQAMRPTVAWVAQLQETYLSEHRRYAPDLVSLGFVSAPSITVRLVHAEANAWAVAVANADTPGRGCAMWYGAAIDPPPRTPGGLPVPVRGRIVCDP